MFEFLVIEVTIASEKVLLCMFYRPPSSSTKKYLDKFEEFAKMVSSKKRKIILMGHFNIDTSSVSHDSSTSVSSSTLATDFLTKSLAAGFVPSVWIPTWVTNQNASIIDNQLVNFPVGLCDVMLTDVSDHFILMSEFLRYSGENGHAKLLYTDWSQCLESDDVEFVFRSFTETFQNALKETCPLMKKRCKKYQMPVMSWITRGLHKSTEEKNRLSTEYINSPTSNNETIFKSYKNHLTRLIR